MLKDKIKNIIHKFFAPNLTGLSLFLNSLSLFGILAVVIGFVNYHIDKSAHAYSFLPGNAINVFNDFPTIFDAEKLDEYDRPNKIGDIIHKKLNKVETIFRAGFTSIRAYYDAGDDTTQADWVYSGDTGVLTSYMAYPNHVNYRLEQDENIDGVIISDIIADKTEHEIGDTISFYYDNFALNEHLVIDYKIKGILNISKRWSDSKTDIGIIIYPEKEFKELASLYNCRITATSAAYYNSNISYKDYLKLLNTPNSGINENGSWTRASEIERHDDFFGDLKPYIFSYFWVSIIVGSLGIVFICLDRANLNYDYDKIQRIYYRKKSTLILSSIIRNVLTVVLSIITMLLGYGIFNIFNFLIQGFFVEMDIFILYATLIVVGLTIISTSIVSAINIHKIDKELQ